MSEIAQTEFNDKTNIKVVGVGGAGGNAVNRMIAEGLQNVEFVAVNTDAKDLLRSDADVKISLGDNQNRGLGGRCRSRAWHEGRPGPSVGYRGGPQGADMVFVTCGEGGGTGTGASPIVARAAHQQGALTIAVVTRPFAFEGPQRAKQGRTRHREPAQGGRCADRHPERPSAGAVRSLHRHRGGVQDRGQRVAGGRAGHHGSDHAELVHPCGLRRCHRHPARGGHGAVRHRFGPRRGPRHQGRRDRHQLAAAGGEHRGRPWRADQHRRPERHRPAGGGRGHAAGARRHPSGGADHLGSGRSTTPTGTRSRSPSSRPASTRPARSRMRRRRSRWRRPVASAQPSPISVTPAQPQAPVVTEQTTPAFAPSTGDAASRSFDETTEHDVISSNDPSDLDIPDFLR